jgi:two-component system, NarL family, nitrate/nitrite response regulator NarL
MDRFSVFLVDPDRLFREGLKRILADGAFEIVGEARSVDEAREALGRGGRVDLVVLEVTDSEEAATAVLFDAARSRGIKTVVLTADRSPAAIGRAIGWSVDAYLLKDMSPEALTRSLQLVMLGQQILPTALMMSVLNADAAPASAGGVGSSIRGLSPREVQILRYLTTGHSNKAIARALDISEATVKVHLKALLRKVQVNNRTQAAIWAMNNGIGEQAAASENTAAAR